MRIIVHRVQYTNVTFFCSLFIIYILEKKLQKQTSQQQQQTTSGITLKTIFYVNFKALDIN